MWTMKVMGMRPAWAGAAALAVAVIATAGVMVPTMSGQLAARADTKSAVTAKAPAAIAKAPTVTGKTSAVTVNATVREGICTAPVAYKSLAAKLSADIQSALRGRAGDHAVTVYDRVTGVDCLLNSGRHFDSASVVKTIILAALLRWHQETGKPLSSTEKYEATLMITQSDNDAATYLWDEVGMNRLQHFLNLAKMSETELGQDGYWGLTQITAHDEMLLLRLLTGPNTVLTSASRSYELGLMAKVISSQRWGTPAGAPSYVTVHVKNGWLPDDTGWHINSTGAFTGHARNYMMVVLTDDNPTEDYGIDSIQAVARLVHRDINAAQPKQK